KNLNNFKNLFFESESIFNFISDENLKNISDGKYRILNEDIYANVQTYQTKEKGLFEAHRQYIDLQFIVSGEEKIGVADIKNCKTITAYDKEKDVEFLDAENFDDIIMKENDFLILYPEDAHRPCITIDNPTTVKKVVVKISTKFKA
ncbi:YhcH/YjgK/YiaL family protein, partial [bacterium]|nr:YhcH/YjgK/YiaL family protein [bacterium]